MMKMLYRGILFIGLISIMLQAKAGAQIIRSDTVLVEGIVKAKNLQPMPYRVSISTQNADSLSGRLLYSKEISTAHFRVKIPKINVPITVSILYPEYKVMNRNIGVVTSYYNMGTIELETDTLKTQQLTEVVVTGKKPVVIERGPNTIYNIQGTMLAESGSLRSLIQRLPNLSIIDNKISVMDAYGIETVILLNNQQISNINLLDILQSNNIKKIEIERDPGVQYSGKVVIKIETVRRISDYMYQDIASSYKQGHRASGTIGTNMILKLGKFQGELSYKYDDNKQITNDENFRLMPEDGSEFSLLDKTKTYFRDRGHNVLVNLGYAINNRTDLSLLYNTSFMKNQTLVLSDRHIHNQSTSQHYQFDQENKVSSQMHSVSLGLTHTLKNHGKLTFLTDYAYVSSTSDYVTIEGSEGSAHSSKVQTQADNRSHLIDVIGNYQFTALWGSDLNIGAKFNSIVLPTTYRYVDIPHILSATLVNDIKTKEQSYKIYMDIQKWLAQRWQLHAGMSYDHTYRSLNYLEGNRPKEYALYYNNLIPTASISYLFSNVSYINLGLSVPFTKPRFEDLIPSMIYKDSLSYQRSEPNIRASKTYIFSAIWRYQTFSLIGRVVHLPYFDERTYERADRHSYIMRSVIAPFYNQTFSQLTASYAKLWDNGLFIQPMIINYYRPYFINGKVSQYKFSYYPMLTFGYRNRTIYAWTKLSYLSAMSNGIQWVDTTGFSFDAGLTASLLEDKLTIDFSVPNITRMKIPRQYSINGGMKWGVTPIDRDPEYFQISIRYKIFNKKVRSNQQQGNQEELNRLL